MFDLTTVTERTLLDWPRLESLNILSLMVGDVKGCIVEVGVYRGGSALLLVEANLERKVHLFDTFEGIPHEPWELDGHKVGDFVAAYEEVSALFWKYKNVYIHKGIFPETMPKDIEKIALAHIDVDMELSARNCIISLWPLIAPGGVMVFDDYNAEACRGVKRAVDEFFGEKNVAIGPHPQAWVVKGVDAL